MWRLLVRFLPFLGSIVSRNGLIAVALAAASAGAWSSWKLTSLHYKNDRLAAVERALAQAEKIHQEDMAMLAGSHQIIESVRTEIRYVEREYEAVDTPDCTDLGPHWIRLHNQAAAAANRARTGSPAD